MPLPSTPVTVTVRQRLVALVLVSVLPLMVLLVGWILFDHQRDVTQARDSAQRTARAVSTLVDSELQQVQASLVGLASSGALAGSPDLVQFHRRCEVFSRLRGFRNLVLLDGEGRQVVNTLRPHGAPLPAQGAAAPGLAMFKTGRPQARVIAGAVIAEPVVAIGIPVHDDHEIRWALTAALRFEFMQQLLDGQKLPAGWIAAVLDDQGLVVARTAQAERFRGHPARDDVRQLLQTRGEGSIEGTTLDGIDVVTVVSRAPNTGWGVVIGIPRAQLVDPLLRQLRWSLLACAVVSLLGVAAAWRFGAAIDGSVQTLLQAVAQLRRGEPAEPPPLAFREAEQLRLAFTRASAEIRAAHAELVRSNLDLQRFAHAASHDLRSPLRALGGYLTLLQRRHGPGWDPSARAYLGRAIHAVEQMDRLTHELLAYAQLRQGTRRFETVDLQPILAEIAAGLAPQLQGATLDLEPLPLVHGDPVQLARLLQNLLANALAYRGERPARITVSAAAAENDAVCITVADNGQGVPTDARERIFEPLERLHAHSEVAGTGLGLAICRDIVQRHGGRIWVEAAPAGGSAFRFTLPLAKVPGPGHA